LLPGNWIGRLRGPSTPKPNITKKSSNGIIVKLSSNISPLWFPFLLLIVVQVLFMMRSDSPIPNHALWGTDGYMRLVRVEALATTGDWFNSTIDRANTPFGDTLHWTRPMDLVLLAGAAPLIPILGLKEALYWWGAVVSPVLHWITLFALFWAARPLFSRAGLVYLGVVSLTQPALLSYFSAARPDHHGLIALIFVLMLGYGLRLANNLDVSDVKTALMGGMVGGLGLWVSVEFLLPLALLQVALGLGWLKLRAHYARAGSLFSIGVVIVTVLALVVERPLAEWLAVEYDTISIVHLAVFAAILAFWRVVQNMDGWKLTEKPENRLTIGLFGTLFVLTAIYALYPLFFTGPYAAVDGRVVEVWFKNIAEVRPLINSDNPLKSLREFLFLLGPVLLALPWLVHLIRNDHDRHRMWIMVALCLIIFVPLSLYQARWATYAELILILPYTSLILALLDRLDQGPEPLEQVTRVAKAAARGAVVAGMATLFLLLTVIVYKFEHHPDKGAANCRMSAMSKYLATEPTLNNKPRRFMSLVFYGPEIIYRSQHSAVGTPYQRNTKGILDTVDFFAATDAAVARKIAEARGLDTVMLCIKAKEKTWYKSEETGPDTLFERLSADTPPDWLKPLPLPEHLKNFRLYDISLKAGS
jgi:hypothetical protein